MSILTITLWSLAHIFYGENTMQEHSLLNINFQGIFLVHLTCAQVEPVNRYFSAASDDPQPDLECVVGVESAATSELYKVKCTDAWNISVKYDRKKANSLAADKHISEHDRRLRTIRYSAQCTYTVGKECCAVFPGLVSKAVVSSYYYYYYYIL